MLSELIAIVTLLVSISLASERLVEILKAYLPQHLFQEVPAPDCSHPEVVVAAALAEAKRKARVHMLAALCGIVTAALASPAITNYTNLFTDKSHFPQPLSTILIILALGLFSSGGSGLWNSVLEYLLKVKGIKDAEDKLAASKAEKLKAETDKAKAEKAQAEAAKARAETKPG